MPRHHVNLGSLQVSELDEISEDIEKDSSNQLNDSVTLPVKQRKITVTLMIIASLFILIVTNFIVDTYLSYISISETHNVVANLLLAVYAIAIGALVLYIGLTIKHYMALKDAFEIQGETAKSDEYEDQRKIALKILDHYQSHPDIDIKEKVQNLTAKIITNSVHSPFLEIKKEIIDDLDKQATDQIYKSAKDISLFTAFSPGSALDSIAVMFISAKLMKNIFNIYGFRTNFITSLLIARKILQNASLAAMIEYADDSVNDILGNTLLSKISVKIAQGIGNGVLMLRIGNVLIQSARPFASDGSIGTYRQMSALFLAYIKERISK